MIIQSKSSFDLDLGWSPQVALDGMGMGVALSMVKVNFWYLDLFYFILFYFIFRLVVVEILLEF